MSEAKPQVSEPSAPTALTLFDLFKDYTDYEVEWGAHKVPVRFLALDYGQQMKLNRILDQSRDKARREIDTPEHREEFEAAARLQPVDALIKQILVFEEPAADALADLAPNIEDDDDDTTRDKKLTEAKDRWRVHREQELKEGPKDDLYAVVVERQIGLAIQSQAVNTFVDHCLVEQVVDPASGQRLLSEDPKAPNYFERLAGPVRRQLSDLRLKFMLKDIDVRRLAEDGGFLPSGPSPSAPAATPGATTETPPGSPPPSSPSTSSEGGSTA